MWIRFFTLALLMLFSVAHGEYYKLYVERIDQDLYKDRSGMYIRTEYCYVYTYGEEAILKYEEGAFNNSIRFDSGQSCDVDEIF